MENRKRRSATVPVDEIRRIKTSLLWGEDGSDANGSAHFEVSAN